MTYKNKQWSIFCPWSIIHWPWFITCLIELSMGISIFLIWDRTLDFSHCIFFFSLYKLNNKGYHLYCIYSSKQNVALNFILFFKFLKFLVLNFIYISLPTSNVSTNHVNFIYKMDFTSFHFFTSPDHYYFSQACYKVYFTPYFTSFPLHAFST